MSKKTIEIYDFELGKLVVKPTTNISKLNKVIKKRVQKIKRKQKPDKEPV